MPSVEALELEVEFWHRDLSGRDLTLRCDPDGAAHALTLEVPADLVVLGETRVAPAALAFGARSRELLEELRWPGLALRDVSPYLSVETTLVRDGLRTTRRCLVKCRLVADPADRHSRLLSEFLRDKFDVLRLLVLLLGEPSLAEEFAAVAGPDEDAGQSRRAFAGNDLPLFELLVKALSRNPEALERIARLREELRVSPDLEDLLPDGFEDLWIPVRNVWLESTR